MRDRAEHRHTPRLTEVLMYANTTCPDCQASLLVPTAAVLLVREAETGSAWMICERCSNFVHRRLSAAQFETLARGGGHVVVAQSAQHPELRPVGPLLVADDLLALHELLSDDDAVADALRGVSATTDLR